MCCYDLCCGVLSCVVLSGTYCLTYQTHLKSDIVNLMSWFYGVVLDPTINSKIISPSRSVGQPVVYFSLSSHPSSFISTHQTQ